MSYSCVVALPAEEEWTEKSTQEFSPLKNVFDEVIIVSPDQALNTRLPPNFKRITCPSNRKAQLLNRGAEEAKSDYLCFINHGCDFNAEDFARLRLTLKTQTLFYLNFNFFAEAPRLSKINSWATNFRSDTFSLPFLSQSFSMDKKSFFNVGAFSERVLQNEDAEFIKRWKKKGYFVKKAKGEIKNDARCFQERGWLKASFKSLSWHVKYSLGKVPIELH